MKEDRPQRDDEGRVKLYADIAHPINSTCREMIQERVISAFREELDRSKLPGYVSNYDDFDEDRVAAPAQPLRRDAAAAAPPAPASEMGRQSQSQPREARDRGPHKPSAREGKHSGEQQRGGFGAGIF
jgi:stage V sporulation protein G